MWAFQSRRGVQQICTYWTQTTSDQCFLHRSYKSMTTISLAKMLTLKFQKLLEGRGTYYLNNRVLLSRALSCDRSPEEI